MSVSVDQYLAAITHPAAPASQSARAGFRRAIGGFHHWSEAFERAPASEGATPASGRPLQLSS
jgi:hypothetical protein